MSNHWLVAGAVLGGLGVILGAFGSHGLKTRVEPALIDVFETGVRYQMYHALALLAVGLAAAQRTNSWLGAAGWLFVAGVAIFSGSLYLMTLTGARWLGAITPLGGVALILGWAALAIGVYKKGS